MFASREMLIRLAKFCLHRTWLEKKKSRHRHVLPYNIDAGLQVHMIQLMAYNTKLLKYKSWKCCTALMEKEGFVKILVITEQKIVRTELQIETSSLMFSMQAYLNHVSQCNSMHSKYCAELILVAIGFTQHVLISPMILIMASFPNISF